MIILLSAFLIKQSLYPYYMQLDRLLCFTSNYFIPVAFTLLPEDRCCEIQYKSYLIANKNSLILLVSSLLPTHSLDNGIYINDANTINCRKIKPETNRRSETLGRVYKTATLSPRLPIPPPLLPPPPPPLLPPPPPPLPPLSSP